MTTHEPVRRARDDREPDKSSAPRGLAVRRTVAVLVTAIILGFIWSPQSDDPSSFLSDIAHSDKLAHLAGFASIAGTWRWSTGSATAFVLAAVLGALSELVQGVLPWPRTPDILDFLFDLVGAAIGTMAVHAWLRAKSPPRRASTQHRDT